MIDGGQFDADRADFERLVELERDGVAFAGLRVARELDGLAAVGVEDVIQMLFALQRGSQFRIGGTKIDAVTSDRRKRQNGDVAIEIHDGSRFREIDFQPFAAFRVCFGERDGLHGVLLLDPWTAAGRPARTVVEADLHAVRRRAFDGILDHRKPFRRKGFDIAVREALPDVQNGETAEARLVHGVDIGLDAFFRDVVVEPMPPCLRLGLHGRRGESFIKIIRMDGDGHDGHEQCDEAFQHGCSFWFVMPVDGMLY